MLDFAVFAAAPSRELRSLFVSSTEAGLGQQTPSLKKPTASAKFGLDAMFTPNSVAVIGATARPGTVGQTVLENLLHTRFQGKVFAVNPKHEEVLGLKAYKSIRDIPESVDLAVVVTPAATVPQLIAECVESGAKSAVVISAGFKERGPGGIARSEEHRSE